MVMRCLFEALYGVLVAATVLAGLAVALEMFTSAHP